MELQTKINKIIMGNCIKEMKKFTDESIDLIFADPPYNMQLDKVLKRYDGTEFNGVSDEWDKFKSLDDYDLFSKKWMKQSLRILKPNGSLWVIGSFQNIHRLGYLLQDMNAWIINEIIWQKSNPVPNFLGTRFVNSHETLIWVTKKKNSKYTFNYKTMKYINDGKQMKSVWKIPISNGKERLKDKNGKKIHSTQKPLKLLKKIIIASTNYGDVVLDPFSGTGTTAHAAKMLGRKYIGIEKDASYVRASIKRLENVSENKNKMLKKAELDIKPQKINFFDLIKKEYITTKTKLDINKVVFFFNKDATITYNGKKYSPNMLLRVIFGKPLNAWNNIIVNEKPIDYLRKKYIKEFF